MCFDFKNYFFNSFLLHVDNVNAYQRKSQAKNDENEKISTCVVTLTHKSHWCMLNLLTICKPFVWFLSRQNETRKKRIWETLKIDFFDSLLLINTSSTFWVMMSCITSRKQKRSSEIKMIESAQKGLLFITDVFINIIRVLIRFHSEIESYEWSESWNNEQKTYMVTFQQLESCMSQHEKGLKHQQQSLNSI